MRGTTFEEVQERLQHELDVRGGNIRGLARDIAAADANTNPESVRRAIYRILTEGSEPKPETSKMLERALKRRAGYFTVASDSAAKRADRLVELEAKVQRHEVSIGALLQTVRLLHGQVKALGGEVPDLPELIAEPLPGVGGTGA